jgi:predicted amidohydrolase YtcJ
VAHWQPIIPRGIIPALNRPPFTGVAVSISRLLCAALSALVVSHAAGAQQSRADLVLLHGDLFTVDSQHPRAQAIAVRGDRIAAVGSDADVQRCVGPNTRVVDLHGRLGIPGFIDGHGHYTGLGESKLVLDLTKASTWDDIVAQVRDAAAAARPGTLIEGRGWHQEKWTRPPQPNVEGVPLHASLDAVSARNPVILEHASGHASFVNGAALRLAGVGRDTPNPSGGEIVKDSTGEPTGLLKESAQGLMQRARAKLPRLTKAEDEARFRKIVRLAGDDALSKGVTSFHDAGSSFATIDGFRQLAREGKLPVRLYVMVRFESDSTLDAKLDRYRMSGFGNGMLTVRSIKQQIDGALGSHGALLLEPYTDLPSSTGLTLKPVPAIEKTARIALKHDFQVNIHAIGDRANREVLDVYERIFRDNPSRRDLRWRIEHAQHIDPIDVPRFKQLGVIASMQGVHTISDGPWVAKRLGEERARRTSYLWRSLMDAGTIVTNGTDTPVEDVDPIMSFYGSVTRKTREGVVFVPEQRVSREEGLRAYTLNNAYAAFEEKEKGSLAPGKLADIVVLSKNVMTIPDDEIPTARVDLTILGGKVRYERRAAATAARAGAAAR